MGSLAPGLIGVAGDVTVDWAVVSNSAGEGQLQLPYLWERRGTALVAPLPGGAALIRSLIEGLLGTPVAGPELTGEALTNPQCEEVTRTFATWGSVSQSGRVPAAAWRMKEFLGQEPGRRSGIGQAGPIRPDVLVLDDANLGFRDDTVSWNGLLAGRDPSGPIVVRMAPPIGAGPLWEFLSERRFTNVTLVLSLGDLRKEDAAIGQPLSWERTGSEIAAAVRDRADLRPASRIVVGIGLSGAVLFEDESVTLIYDPENLEGDWERAHPGLPYGANAALVAAIAAGCSQPGDQDLAQSVVRGLRLARGLHLRGLAVSPGAAGKLADPRDCEQDAAPVFQCCPVGAGAWTILGSTETGDGKALARALLLGSAGDRVAGVPLERMGAWVSVDRAEIEGVRSVRNIISEYLEQAAPPRPLSVAVFGPPGCGKSFSIKQMAGQLATAGRRIEILEFNVSQFEGANDLAAAFQRVRDCAVSGSLPLVFWDEFDSARGGLELGWLATFLAPMQDGIFLEGGIARPIGPAVFVFAGGTHHVMESFRRRASEVPSAKATDFLSRLRGFVDVLGPNPAGPDDHTFLVRRALLLRQILRRRAPQLASDDNVAIDTAVADAFLSVSAYLHGARSMEAIVEMSALSGRARYTRSALPAAHQLNLHVDSTEFLALAK